MPIVPAQVSDIPQLVHLVNGAYRGMDSMKGWTDESHLLEGARTDAGGLLELMNDDHSVIMKYIDPAKRVAGCVYLQKRGDRLYLGLLSVLPELQGTGLGKELLGAADDHARENHCLHIYITVISARHELVAWYERHGYQRTGETEAFHAGEKFGIQKQPLELIVLVKNLS